MRVDFHSHFLPGIDDGARRPADSVEILKYLKNNGFETVCATPHYSLRHESVKSFLRRREESVQKLYGYMEEKGIDPNEIPNIVLGAEVAFYPGLCELPDLKELSFGNNSILIELQFAPLGKWEIEEVYNVMYQHHLSPVMAHINRYVKLFSSFEFEEIFLNSDVAVQINSECSQDIFLFPKMKKIIKSGLPVVFGCDIHQPELVSKSGLEKMKKFISGLSDVQKRELAETERNYITADQNLEEQF